METIIYEPFSFCQDFYVNHHDAPAAESEEISPGVILDYNAEGKVVGIEMLYLSKRVSAETPKHMQLETLGV